LPASIVTVIEPVRREARNVAALLPGTDPHGGQTLVIGAHYDHLGFGGAGSLSPNAIGEVHNGADDNASGTAVLIEAARKLATGPRLAQNLLFIAFTGEERGLWGSAHYMESPLLPLDGTIAMLNLDMVGRVVDDALTVFGTGTAEEWTGVLDRANAAIPSLFDLRYNSDGFGGSDHSSFYAQGIPVLHFFSNTHPEYHRVEDDWELVNAAGMRVSAASIINATARAMMPEKPRTTIRVTTDQPATALSPKRPTQAARSRKPEGVDSWASTAGPATARMARKSWNVSASRSGAASSWVRTT